jgi:hypothetical protein
MKYTHQKGSTGLIIILALALILGALFIFRSKPTIAPTESTAASVRVAPTPLKEAPLYPELTWDSGSSASAFALTSSSGNSTPLTGTLLSATRQDTDQDVSLEALGAFENYYDTALTADGWVRNEITLNDVTIAGPLEEGVADATWSYLKVHNGALYTVVLSTESTGDPSLDGEYERACPCSTVFTLFKSGPIPVSNI